MIGEDGTLDTYLELPLAVPATVHGTLVTGDRTTPEGPLEDEYTLNLTAGQNVIIDARGGPMIGEDGTLDTYLELLHGGTAVAHDDDGGGFPNARITYTATAAGPYTLRVRTFGHATHQGNYELTTAVAAAAGPATPLTVPTPEGHPVAGTLATGDTATPEGPLADDYTINLTAGQPVTIIARGGPLAGGETGTLDPYLELSQGGSSVAHDDDGAGFPNPRIVYTPTTTGPHTLRVRTFGHSVSQGAYVLEVLAGAHEDAH